MPFASKKQQRWAYANKKKLKKKGFDVDEWSAETDYDHLPEEKKKEAMILKAAFPQIPAGVLAAGDITGLGILAEPTIHGWISGRDAVSERERDLAEVGGLGLLAATTLPKMTGHESEGVIGMKGWRPAIVDPPIKHAFAVPQQALLAGDIVGLGVLAEPTVHKWISGKDAVSDAEHDAAEIGGLGILAATQIPHMTGHVSEHPIFPKLGAMQAVIPTLKGESTFAHGRDVQQPLLQNPYNPGDPERAAEYQNGYEYAMGLGHSGLQNYDPMRARDESVAWREGFAEGAEKLGRRDVGMAITSKQAELSEGDVSALLALRRKQNVKFLRGMVVDGTPEELDPDNDEPRLVAELEEQRRIRLRQAHTKVADHNAADHNAEPPNTPISLEDHPEVNGIAPGLLFDIDGTLVEDGAYLNAPEGQKLLPGVLEKLMALSQQGLRMAVVTNRSIYDQQTSPSRLVAMNSDILAQAGGTLRDVYFMPLGPSEHHKPAGTMLTHAMLREGIDPKQCAYVGNAPEDAAAAEAAGIPFIHASEFFGEPKVAAGALIPQGASLFRKTMKQMDDADANTLFANSQVLQRPGQSPFAQQLAMTNIQPQLAQIENLTLLPDLEEREREEEAKR